MGGEGGGREGNAKSGFWGKRKLIFPNIYIRDILGKNIY